MTWQASSAGFPERTLGQRGKRVASKRRSKLRRYALESLEPRTLMAQIPTPTVLSRSDVSNLQNNIGQTGDHSSPSITVDPNDPLRVVSVWTRQTTLADVAPTNLSQYVAGGAYSTDGGQTWNELSLPPVIGNPAALPAFVPYLRQTDSSVAFDRNHNFFVISSQHQLDNKQGSIVLQKYDFSGAAPVIQITDKIVQQWQNNGGGIGDQVFTPTLAVDAGAGNDAVAANQPAGTPTGVVIGPDGNIYTSYPDANQVQRFDALSGIYRDIFASGSSLYQPDDLTYDPVNDDLYIANHQTGTVIHVDGASGVARGVANLPLASPKTPTDSVIGPDGNLYVASRDTDSILKYNGTTGKFQGTFVPRNSGGLKQPRGLVFGVDGILYVTSVPSAGTGEVLRYDGTTGEPLGTFVLADAGLVDPRGLTFGPDGNLYVASFGTNDVQRFDRTTGVSLGVFTNGAPGAGLQRPIGLAFGPDDGNLYVTSYIPDLVNPLNQKSEVLRFNGTTGLFISSFLAPPAGGLDGPTFIKFRPDGLYVSSFNSDSILKFNKITGHYIARFMGDQSGALDGPTGMAFAANGDVFVNSQLTNQVLRYDASGNFLRTITPEPLKSPRASVLGPDGFLYVTSRDTDSVMRFDPLTGQFLGTFVQSGSGGLNIPMGLAFGPDGNLYVGSGFDDRIRKYSGINGAFLGIFIDSKVGGLDDPEGMVFRNGKLYVTSSKTNSVLQFSATTGDLISVFTPEPIRTPEDVTYGPDGFFYVASRDGNNVLRYNGATGAFVSVFVKAGDSPLKQARGLQFLPNGDLLVSSFETDQVLRFKGSDGSYLGAFTPEPLKAPDDAVRGPDGNLYVVSTLTDTVLKYDGTTGAYISAFVTPGSGGLTQPSGLVFTFDNSALLVSSRDTGRIFKYSAATGAFQGVFVDTGLVSIPEAMTLDALGRLYVTDSGTDEVHRFNGTTGQDLGVFVVAGSGGLNGARGLAFGPDGNLYVASFNTNQVLKYRATNGQSLGVFATSGTGLNAIDGPTAIAFGRDGNLYVSSFNNDRVLRYNGLTGAFRDAVARPGQGGLDGPAGLAFNSGGNLLVVSRNTSRVLGFDTGLGRDFGSFIDAAGNLNVPTGMTISRDGGLFVSSFSDNRVGRYNATTGAFVSDFVTAGLGGLVGPRSVLFGPDGNFYVLSSGTNQVIRYNGGTGALIGVFTAPAPAGLSDPWSMVFGPDGNLYVLYATSAGGPAVARFNGGTGALIGTFVTPGSSSLAAPRDLAFGPDGNLYISSSGTSAVLRFSGTNGGFIDVFVTPGSGGLAAPSHLLFGRDGTLFVTDFANDNVLRYNGTTGAFIENFASGPKLDGPRAIIFGREGNLLVASSATKDVVTFSGANGAYRNDFTPKAVPTDPQIYHDFTPEPLAGPTGMVLDGLGHLDVASRNSDQILRYDAATGAFVDIFNPPPIRAPQDGVLGPDGKLYVSSPGTNEIFRFDPAGGFLNVFVTKGAGGLTSPGSIAFGPDGNLYVASPGTGEILRYSGKTGAFYDVFVTAGLGGLATPAGIVFDPAGNLLVGSSNNVIYRYDRFGAPAPSAGNTAAIFSPAGTGGLSGPAGMLFDAANNRLIVASSGNSTVISINGTTGASIAALITTGLGGLSNPRDMVFDGSGRLYVSSAGTSQVIRYVLNAGNFVFDRVIVPSGTGGLNGPAGLLFDASSNLIVNSAGSDLVLKFSVLGTAGSFINAVSPEILKAPEDVVVSPTDATVLLASSFTNDDILSFNTATGQEFGQFVTPGSGGLDGPQSLLFGPDFTGDNKSDLFVSSELTNSVLIFDGVTGAFVTVFIAPGAGGLAAPQGLAFHVPSGDLLVSSRDTDEVLRFGNLSGAPLGGFTPSPLNRPVGLTFGPDGNLYVTSRVTSTLAADGKTIITRGKDQVIQYNGVTGAYINVYTSPSLDNPQDAILGPDGNLYVASKDTNEVFRFNGTTGAFIDVFVPKGSGGLQKPSGLAFDAIGNLYVGSQGTNQVLRYRKDTGAFINVFVATGLNQPEEIIFDPAGNLYVADAKSNQVLRFKASSGQPLPAPGKGGALFASAGLSEPNGLAFGPDGKLYVSSMGSNQVFRYDNVTGNPFPNPPGTGIFVDNVNNGDLDRPGRIKFAPDNTLMVASTGTGGPAANAVLRYNGFTGAFIDQFVTSARGGLNSPAGITFLTDGSMIVSSAITDQILRYNGTFGSFTNAFTPGPLRGTTGLAFGPDGRLYVSSSVNDQVIRFSTVVNGGTGVRTGLMLDNFVESGAGALDGPEGLVFNANGQLLVSSRGSDNITRYNGANGRFVDGFSPEKPRAPGDSVFGPDGFLYVISRDTNSVLRYDAPGGKLLGTFVKPRAGATLDPNTGDLIGGLGNPQGLAFGPDGNLYVTSITDATGLAADNSVLRFSGTTGAFIDSFVLPGVGGLSLPQGLTFDSAGSLYVASFNSDSVLKYNGATGAFLTTFVLPDGKLLDGPTAVKFGPDGNLYVASYVTDQIIKYQGADGKLIGPFVARAMVDPNDPTKLIRLNGGLDGPIAMAFGPGGDLFVASDAQFTSRVPGFPDFQNDFIANESSQDNRVLRFKSGTGAFVGEFVGRGNGELSGPAGIAFGADGNLYVASRNNNQVLRYNGTTGAFAKRLDIPVDPAGVAFGPDANGDGVQELYVAGANTDSIVRYDGDTGEYIDTFVPPRSGGLRNPTALRIDGGFIYVASAGTNQVLKFNANTGAFAGVAATGNGINIPSGIAIRNGVLFVGNAGANSVLRFSATTGGFLGVFVAPGAGGLAAPRGLAFDTAGNLLVASTANKKVLKYNGTTGAFIGVALGVEKAAFEDPATGAQQNDPFSGNVYIAWATNMDVGAGNINLNAIAMTASSDGGQSFSPPAIVNDDGFTSPVNAYAAPRIAISQGTLDGRIKPGQVTVFWDEFLSDPTRDYFTSTSFLPGVTASAEAVYPQTDVHGYIRNTLDIVDPRPATTRFQIPVNITDPRFTTLSKVSVFLQLIHPDLGQLQIELVGPDGTRVALVRQSLTGARLGGPEGSDLTTIFDQQAPRNINEGIITEPYIGRFQPDTDPGSVAQGIPPAPTLDAFNGLDRQHANGVWTLEITDFSHTGDQFPVQRLLKWGLNFGSGLVDGKDSPAGTTFVKGALSGSKYPNNPLTGPYNLNPSSPGAWLTSPFGLAAFTAATPIGVGPAASIASDNTLGSFSPHPGRIYVAYTSFDAAQAFFQDDTDISLMYTDDGGATWSTSQIVNDDEAYKDGFSEAHTELGLKVGRLQFMPQVAVDDTTGTLAVTFYDARYDAARSRVAQFVAVSDDGGATFAPQTFVNAPNRVTDAITGRPVDLGPIPDNQSRFSALPLFGSPLTNDVIANVVYSFGEHQGLAFTHGLLYPAWSSNENGGPQGNYLLDIRVASVAVAGGPRVVASTMGPANKKTVHSLATGAELTFNGDEDVNGNPRVDGFVVEFDRPIDASTFDISDASVTYRGVTTSGFQTGTPVPVTSVTPLLEGATPLGPTKFLVRFTPSNLVGTYSYVVGPDIRDLARSVVNGVVVAGNPMDQNVNGKVGEDPRQPGGIVDTSPGDVYAAPRPSSPVPINFSGVSFDPPYDKTTQPLVVPGPHIETTFVPSVTPTPDNLVTDRVVSQLAVKFDRDMEPTTIDGGDVLRLVGPSGQIAGPFTFIHDPSESLTHPRTFLVGFAPQKLSGVYTVSLGPDMKSKAGDRVDANLNAGVDVLRGDPTEGTEIKTFTSTGVAQIGGSTPNTVTTSQINVNDNFTVQGVTLTLNIKYPNDPDLTASLIGPDGTEVTLFENVGAAGDRKDFTGTTFDDKATAPISNGGPPFFGTFNPKSPLGLFRQNQVNAFGTWTLRIVDSAANRKGTLDDWTLKLVKPISGTGLGELVADQSTASFRIFTQDPTNPLSTTTWTAVGPAGIGAKGPGLNAEIAGRVNTVAVDPSDPSGNTVFVGAASGGVWKTTNFLTTSPSGPTYVPLTDFGPTYGMNVGSIAVFGQNNNPTQSVVFAGTGDPETLGFGPAGQAPRGDSYYMSTRGVGFLRSTDGGASWLLLDSTTNAAADGTPLPISSPLRDHIFVNTVVYKVVVDPRPTLGGDVIIYAAVSDVSATGTPVAPAATVAGGIWRSVDSGRNWQRMRAGQATDVVLDLNSGTGAPDGNLQILYAAFRNEGIFSSPNRGQVFNPMNGTAGNPLILTFDAAPPQPVNPLGNQTTSEYYQGKATPNSPGTNGNIKGRVTLAKPALTGDPLQDRLYQGWLYAAVTNADSIVTADNQLVLGGHLEGLYLTKDFGQNWTRVRVPDASYGGHEQPQVASNDERWPDFVPHGDETPAGIPIPHGAAVDNYGTRNYALSLAVDPNNPNVVYLGGTKEFRLSGLIRIDTTGIADPHAFYLAHTDTEGADTLAGSQPQQGIPLGGQLGIFQGDPRNPNNPQHGPVTTLGNTYAPRQPGDPFDPTDTPFINLISNPEDPFNLGSTIPVRNVAWFNNRGSQTKWTMIDQAVKPDTFNTDPNDPWSVPASGIHRIVTLQDPTTGRTRLIFGTDNGVFTAVDKGDGTLMGSFGSVSSTDNADGDVLLASGSRNGNLQTAQVAYGAAQPSSLALQVQGLFYINTQGNGFPNSNKHIIDMGQAGYGDLTWSRPNITRGTGAGIGIVQTGPNIDGKTPGQGGVYRYKWPSAVDNGVQTDFFQRDETSRTFNLLQNTAGQFDPIANTPIFDVPDGQWPFRWGSNFTVNPIRGDQVIMSSILGRIFSTENAGQFWNVIGRPEALDNSYAQALAFGAPDPNGPGGEGNLNAYLFAGTVNGNIFVTFTGGGTTGNAWTSLSAGLDGSPVQAIITNPTRGSHEAFAVTSKGVYHMVDSSAAGASWVNITGNLFSLSVPLFGNTSQTQARLKNLTSIVADWRYIIPDTPGVPNSPTHPMLYVGGEGGVFRSITNGQSWTIFPSGDPSGLDQTPSPPGDGGGLPNTVITDLDLSLGNINQTTGRADVTTGPNVMLASTWGRGEFTIRLAPLVFSNLVKLSSTLPPPNGSDSGLSPSDNVTSVIQPVIEGLSEQSAFGQEVTIRLLDLTDPAFPVEIGVGQTDASGRFAVQVIAGYFKSDGSTDGVKTIGVQATDQSGTKGNIAKLVFTLDTQSPAAPSTPDLQAASDSGSSNTDNITTVTTPTFDIVTAEVTALVQLLRKVQGTPDTSYIVVNTRTGPGQIQDRGPVPEGNYVYAANQIDLAGNLSPNSVGLPVTIDTTAPAPPSTPDLQAAFDSGASDTDNVTFFTNPRFDVTAAESTTTVQLLRKLAAAPISTYVIVNTRIGPGEVQDSGPVLDGVYSYAARQIDVAGNIGGISAALQVTIDTIAGGPPSTPDLQTGSDTGASNTDNITSDNSPFFDVTSTEATATVELLRKLATEPTTAYLPKASRVGTGPVQDLGPVPDEVYSYAARQIDLAGNVGPISGALTVTIDAVGPGVVGTPDLEPASDSGILNDDDLTNVKTPSFTVAPAESNATVILFRDGKQVGSRVGPGSIRDNGPITAGPHDYTAQQIDASGNTGGLSAVLTVTFDFTAPAAPIAPDLQASSDSGSSPTDNVTNDTSPTFDLVASDPTASLELLRKLSTAPASSFVVVATIGGTGAAIDDPGPGADGKYSYAARQVDRAGNASATSTILTVTIDSKAPIAPTLVLLPADDTGTPGDRITNVDRPRFTGVTESLVTVELVNTATSVVLKTATSASDGTFVLQPDSKLIDGVYALRSRATDAAGNSSESGDLAITIDKTPPAAPSAPDLTDASDSGRSNTDNITNKTAPTFTIATAEVGATVRLFRDGAQVGTRVGPGDIQDPGAVADGKHTYTSQQVDAAGNVGALSVGLDVIIDTKAPSTPGIPDLRASSDSGVSQTDNITNATNLVFDVVATDPTFQLELLRSGVSVGLILGSGTITDANPAEGNYSYSARQIDPAGNIGPTGGVLPVIVDRKIAVSPVLALLAADDSGAKGDGVTNVVRPRLTSQTDAFASVELIDAATGNTLASLPQAGSDGKFTIQPTANLPQGVNRLLARARDLAGNVLDGPEFSVTIDTAPPLTPTLSMDPADDLGSSNSDAATSVTRPHFIGRTDPNTPVDLLNDQGTVLASGVSLADGTFTLQPTTAFLDGVYVLTVRATDVAANTSTSAGLVVTISTEITTNPTLSLLAADDSGAKGDGLTNVKRPRLTGTSDPGIQVELIIANTSTVLFTLPNAAADGSFILQPTNELADGTYNLQARVTNVSGLTALSNIVALTIDATKPAIPTLSILPDDDTGFSNTDGITKNVRPRFTGQTDPNTPVNLTNPGGVVFASGVSGPDGKFQLQPTNDLSDGVFGFQARVGDAAGNVSSSPTLNVTIDTIAPPTPVPAIAPADDTGLKGDNVTAVRQPRLIGQTEKGAVVEVLNAFSQVVGAGFAAATDGVFAVPPATKLPLGANNLSVRVRDLAGNQAPSGPSLPVRIIQRPGADFDSDGISDYVSFDQPTAGYRILFSAGGGLNFAWGLPGFAGGRGLPVSADYDGDGRPEYTTFDATTSTFYILYAYGAQQTVPYGPRTGRLVPVGGDYDGDGRTDLAVYNPTAAQFIVTLSSGGGFAPNLGVANNRGLPVNGDYDGDGRTDLTVFDPVAAAFYIAFSSVGSVVRVPFGVANRSLPIAGDYDGDGRTDLAVYDTKRSTFYIAPSSGGSKVVAFGIPAPAGKGIPIGADYDGDGRTDIAEYDRPSAQFIVGFSSGNARIVQLGIPNGKGIPSPSIFDAPPTGGAGSAKSFRAGSGAARGHADSTPGSSSGGRLDFGQLPAQLSTARRKKAHPAAKADGAKRIALRHAQPNPNAAAAPNRFDTALNAALVGLGRLRKGRFAPKHD